MSDNWIEAASRDAIPGDDVIGVVVGGREIALYDVNGDVFATDNACTHGNARLCDGFLDGHEIECPLHQGKFDVRTGEAMCAPLTEAVRRYPIRIEADKVYVDLG
ncbi:non-heme iron oxygenase ferredoxin subunit [Pandoraea terrigena]|uniref:Naphthalene 1,2-dioxygenase n=1 Tax=Pandoraea terrigena TaxID=2508292 RepID=A0A5E4T1P4_9BURK|nr:non-heme iron oxygenase ferredoxin subunit [Pandoraea terrigena]VVD80364.1 naphthalene 1,2-dioxygenase [Pandoraea terrigena]